MVTKIRFVIDSPVDPKEADALEQSVPELIALADRFPRLERVESAKVRPRQDDAQSEMYRTLDFYFGDYDDAEAALASPAAAEFVKRLDRTGTSFNAHVSEVDEH